MKHSILVVDDLRENVRLLFNVFGKKYDLYAAHDGVEALDLLRRRKMHLVIADQRMPGITGVELLEKARALRPDCVRILITAFPDVGNAVEAINRGQVKRFIAKPFNPAEIRQIVAQELEHLELELSHRRLSWKLERTVERLSKANRELQELDRMKDLFLAGCSHELKTPLVSGMGYLDLMLSGGMGVLDPRQEKGLKIAQRNLERLLGLIENLLELTRTRYRPGQIRRSHFSLRRLVDECVESLKGRAQKKSLRVTVSFPHRLPEIDGDERKIHGVLTNVLANAEKFTPDEARIGIRVRRKGKGCCEVVVSDNGPGPGKSGGEIRPFASGPARGPSGLGIGLALSREVLRAHKCDIRLEQGRRGGARVRFDLPLARG